jgi:hypothetical protein
MQFSAMTMNMFFPNTDDPDDDNRIIDMAVEQSIWLAELGYHVWFTDHHFRGPWHSNPMQFASYVAPLIPRDRYIGFGVLSIPFYHPLRLVESILREIRRPPRVVGAFPDGQSALNLAAARLRHVAGTEWSTKRYLRMDLLKDHQSIDATD